MNLTVRKGTKADMPSVHALICELAEFEKAPQEVTNTIADLESDGFGANPYFQCLVAELDGEIVGMALYFFKYSTWKGKGIYLDDIVVRENMRSKGVGSLLMRELIRVAANEGVNQLHWQVLDWNVRAIAFYRKLSADFDQEWINCKLDQAAIRRLNRSND